MIRPAKRLMLVLGVALLALLGTATQAQANGQQRLVERARLVLDSFVEDPNFENMRVYVQNAYAVLIVPDMLQASFVVGAEHGIGILLTRDPQSGVWGRPVFYDLYGGSVGLQIGGKSSDVVFTIMNENAVKKLIRDGLRLGADVEVAAGRLGSGVGAGTTTQFGEDIYVFAKSKGLFVGMSLEGTVLSPRADWNEAYYGRKITPEEILERNERVMANAAEVAALHRSLMRF